MRSVIYTRVSQDPSKALRSVSEQEEECRALCRRERWNVVRVFTDNDRGASRHSRRDRPAYLALRTFLATGGADVLVMWEGSRAQRDLAAYASLRDLCAERGILYSYSGRTYDLTRTDDRFSTGLDALLAEREADVTRDRVLRAVRANAASGRPHGKLAYGYAREYDPVTKALVRQYIREDQAAVIRECARRLLAGDSLYTIAADLNARGIPAPRGGAWIPTQVKRLMVSPRYIGQRVHQGRVIGDAAWPAILDEDTYLSCVARLTDPRRHVVRDRSLKHLLSGLALCGECGRRMRVIKNRGYLSYACAGGFCTAVRTTKLEEYVTEVALERLSLPDFLTALTDRVYRATGEQLGAADELAALRERLNGFYAAAARGEISPAGLASIETRLLADIAAADERAMSARVPAVLRAAAGRDVRDRWEAMSVGTRREVISTLMTVRIMPTVRGSRFNPERVSIKWRTF